MTLPVFESVSFGVHPKDLYLDSDGGFLTLINPSAERVAYEVVPFDGAAVPVRTGILEGRSTQKVFVSGFPQESQEAPTQIMVRFFQNESVMNGALTVRAHPVTKEETARPVIIIMLSTILSLSLLYVYVKLAT